MVNTKVVRARTLAALNTEQGAVATWWAGAAFKPCQLLLLVHGCCFCVEYRAADQVATAPCSVLSAAEVGSPHFEFQYLNCPPGPRLYRRAGRAPAGYDTPQYPVVTQTNRTRV